MAATLPRNIQLKLDQTLAQWHNWRGETRLLEKPRILRALTPGLSNYSFLVESGQRFVVRIDGLNPAVIGLNRQAEWRALEAASAAGIAPLPRYHNPELGALVYNYVDADANQSASPTQVAQLLRAIHRLPPIHFRLDLRERATRYEKHIEHRGSAVHPLLLSCRDRVLTLLDAINSPSQPQVLCHNDLLRDNRLMSAGALRAIDWEYCAMGNPIFDLAVVCVGDAPGDAEKSELLRAYLGREAEPQERLELSRHESVYRYLELLWFCALDDEAERERQITDSRLQGLEACLGQANP